MAEFVAAVHTIVDLYRYRIKGVAISAPGKVDHRDETIYAGGALPFLDKVNLVDELQLDMPVAVEHGFFFRNFVRFLPYLAGMLRANMYSGE
ncbi:ROK family protein [Weissella confusa]|uniref:ROK family protein n=1 Tax=Weissella confusa TaxID=1583 RepID=A0A923NGR1_WEICO|nr:ROK family protein [Weissella confusa]